MITQSLLSHLFTEQMIVCLLPIENSFLDLLLPTVTYDIKFNHVLVVTPILLIMLDANYCYIRSNSLFRNE